VFLVVSYNPPAGPAGDFLQAIRSHGGLSSLERKNRKMLMIRLMRAGKKNRPFYRIVVQEARHKANGAVLDSLGTYDSLKDGPARIDHERLNKWLARGAQISPTTKSLVRKALKAAAA